MAEVIELETIKRPKIIFDDSIDDSRIMFPEKLREAEEMLEKYPPPANFLLTRYNKQEQQEGIEIQGLLSRANAGKNTFMVLKMNGVYPLHYHIRTTPETLDKLVTAFLNKPISVQIRPQINADNQFEYELLEVKT